MRRKCLLTALLLLGLLAGPMSGPAGRALSDSNPTTSLLTWSPPTLVNPITVTLCNCNLLNGFIFVNLKIGQDYVLYDPVVLTYPLVIQGGHNIVWIGGEIRPSTGPDIGIQLIHNVGYGGGTIHLEGIYLNGVDGVLTDGIEGRMGHPVEANRHAGRRHPADREHPDRPSIRRFDRQPPGLRPALWRLAKSSGRSLHLPDALPGLLSPLGGCRQQEPGRAVQLGHPQCQPLR